MLVSLMFAAATVAAPRPMGYYTVPVKPELRPYAAFDLSCALVTARDGTYHLEYDLPLELVDAPLRHVVLDQVTSAAGFVTMDGPEGHAVCMETAQRLSCMINYNTITVDEAQVQAYVDAKYPEPVEKGFRVKVAAAFGGEPAGILDVAKVQGASTNW